MKTSWTIISVAAILPVAAAIGQAPAWQAKPISAWTATDAVEVLTNSPWSHAIRATVLPKQSEDERRAGGSMGPASGVGFDGLDNADRRKLSNLPKSLYSNAYGVEPLKSPVLGIRWESALPVKAAEVKAGIVEPPVRNEDGYLIAVYGIPGVEVLPGSPDKLGAPLKRQALLRRPGKPDVKPLRAEVFQRDDGPVVAYVFPGSAEITRDDEIEFMAQIGRIYAVCSFHPQAMQFDGKLAIQ
jgi:hypothetical protein